jgi:apolipoprotein N-acyltransferase
MRKQTHPIQPAGRSSFGFWVPVILAGICCSISLMFVSSIAAFVAMSLLFFAVSGSVSKRQLLHIGVLFAVVHSLPLQGWMLSVIPAYAQGSLLASIICYLLSIWILIVFFGLQFWLFGLLRLREDKKYALIQHAVLMACLWVLFEWLRSMLFSALPWLSYGMGITLSDSKYLIQPASWGGPWILSFLLVIASFLIGYAFRTKRWKVLFVPTTLLFLQFVGGALLYKQTVRRVAAEHKPDFFAALIQPALDPETVWNDQYANALVGRLLSLNEQAALQKPHLIVWTETVVPWTYAPADDFVQEIVTRTKSAGAYTLLGMNNTLDTSGDVISNAVHLLDPAGKRIAWYEKQELLTLVEKPLFSTDGDVILPFLAASGMKMHPGVHNQPLPTPWGGAGVLLCNESTSHSQAKDRVEAGASFLVNIGNDGWFGGGYIPLQHFYNCRLRAVETRKDVLVNNNMGFSGLIRADGTIAARYDAAIQGVQLVRVQPNDLPVTNTSIFIGFVLSLFVLTIIHKVLLRTPSSNPK